MQAFLAAVLAICVITAGAHFALRSEPVTQAITPHGDGVRLD